METQDNNRCIRCGKLRIVVKTWKETIHGSPVTYTDTSCPDRTCQKIVDKKLKEKRELAEERRSKASRGKNKPHSNRGA